MGMGMGMGMDTDTDTGNHSMKSNDPGDLLREA